MKKGTCLFVTAKNGQNNRKTFSCGSNEDVIECLGRADDDDRNSDDDDERDKFKEMCLPEGTYFVKIVGYVVSLFGIDQNGNLWVWYFYDEENELLDDSTKADRIKKVTWLSDRGLRVLDIDCGLKGAVIKTEDADGTIKYYAIFEKHGEEVTEKEQAEMMEALGGKSLTEESTNTCIA